MLASHVVVWRRKATFWTATLGFGVDEASFLKYAPSAVILDQGRM